MTADGAIVGVPADAAVGTAPESRWAHRLCVAPMMACTDRHDRYLLRLLSRRARLYTEMITTGAILFGDRRRLLGFDASEHPVALQLGGSQPADLARCAVIGEQWGYDEINMNVGCPSDRVQSGRFGACLMAEPQLVADCVAAMKEAVSIPVTVKTRIGVDDSDSFEELCRFITAVTDAGCEVVIIHARKAWLQGLSPKQNRSLPPLRYEVVYRVKQEFPGCRIVINGGITNLDQAEAHLGTVDGVMIGREAYANPYLLAEVDRRIYGVPGEPLTRRQALRAYACYAERESARGVRLTALTRHVIGLFRGRPGARAWRRHLSEHAHRPDATAEVIWRAAQLVPECRVG